MDFPVTTPGAAQGAADFDRLSQSMTKSAGSWDAMSKGSSKAAAGLGAMSTALGPLGAEFGALGQSVSRSAGIIGNMTALLGGPWGIAIGVAAAGVGFMANQFADAQKESEALTESLKEQAAAALHLAEVQRQYLRDLQAVGEDEIDFKRAGELAKQKELSDKFDRDLELAEAEFGVGPNVGGRSGPRGPSFDDTISKLAGDGSEGPDFEIEALEEERQAIQDAEEAAEKRKQELAKEANDYYIELERERLSESVRMEEEAFERKAQIKQQEKALWQGAIQDVGQLGIRAANEAAKGAAMSKKAMVQSIGDILIASGTKAIAEGGIWSATPFMWGSGTPMVIAGGAAIAAGIGMGAASRGMSGGGGGGASTGTPQLAPASPVAVDRTGGDTRPTVINVTMPTVVSPSAEDGERVTRALEEARRQGRIN
jgi:hypothetical protein